MPAAVVGDALRLRQILVNLIGNALKFTERGEIALTIEPAPGGEPGELHFAVSDSGIGIAKDFTPNTAKKRVVRAALSNSAGFGGHNVSVVVKRYKA